MNASCRTSEQQSNDALSKGSVEGLGLYRSKYEGARPFKLCEEAPGPTNLRRVVGTPTPCHGSSVQKPIPTLQDRQGHRYITGRAQGFPTGSTGTCRTQFILARRAANQIFPVLSGPAE